MSSLNPSLLIGGFLLLWAVTFVPCWYLLTKLVAMSVSGKKPFQFFAYLLLYRLLIAAPYLLLLVAGKDVFPDIIRSLIIGIIVIGIIFSLIRFFFASKVIVGLWWVYGYVYDGLLHYEPYKRLTTAVVNLAYHENPDAHMILELGCGTGNVIVKLHEKYPSAEITGVDFSRSMLAIARKKTANTVQYVNSDILKFLINNKTKYDLIVMQNSLYALEDRGELWLKLVEALNANGAIVITNSDRKGSSSITKEHLRYGKWYQLLRPKLVLVGVIDAFISQLSSAGTFSFLSEADIHAEVKSYFTMSPITRLYGGVNLLFSLRKQSKL